MDINKDINHHQCLVSHKNALVPEYILHVIPYYDNYIGRDIILNGVQIMLQFA